MFDFLAPFGWQGIAFLAVLIPTLVLVRVRCQTDPRYWLVFITTIGAWLGTRLMDVWCDPAGCYGGTIGLYLLSLDLSLPALIATVALGMGLTDFTMAILLRVFIWDLPLARLLVAIYASMIFCYALAAIGIIPGGFALFLVNILGFGKLFAIGAGTSGGAGLVLDWRRRAAIRSPLDSALDTAALWLGTAPHLERDSPAVERGLQAPRHSK